MNTIRPNCEVKPGARYAWPLPMRHDGETLSAPVAIGMGTTDGTIEVERNRTYDTSLARTTVAAATAIVTEWRSFVGLLDAAGDAKLIPLEAFYAACAEHPWKPKKP